MTHWLLRPTPDAAPQREALARDLLDGAAFVEARRLITTRRHVSPRRLVEPGPTCTQLEAMLSLAAAAPDHGLLTPWRFVVVPPAQRERLGDAFARALVERDPGATLEQIEAAREKALRAPLLLVAVACLGPREPDIAPLERMVSMGAAVQNLLLGAHAMGYGAGLTSGRAMESAALRETLELADGEHAVCCISIGSVARAKASGRTRPLPADFVSELGARPARAQG